MVKDHGDVARIAKQTGQTTKAVGAVLETLPKIVAKALKEHGACTLPNLIKLKGKWMPERVSTTKNICGRCVVLPYLRPRIRVRCLPAGTLVKTCADGGKIQ